MSARDIDCQKLSFVRRKRYGSDRIGFKCIKNRNLFGVPERGPRKDIASMPPKGTTKRASTAEKFVSWFTSIIKLNAVLLKAQIHGLFFPLDGSEAKEIIFSGV